MTNNFANFLDGEYLYRYLAKSTNKLTQIFKRLARGNDASGWIGKEQPFVVKAPRVLEVSYAEGTRI